MTKKIEAIFREEKLTAVKDALAEIGIVGMNVVEGDAEQHIAGLARCCRQ